MTTLVEGILVEPRYRRDDGLAVIGLDELPLPSWFEVNDSMLALIRRVSLRVIIVTLGLRSS